MKGRQKESVINSLKQPQLAPGGRPAWNVVQMFKILILQWIFDISDDQMEYQILDRLSFQRFLRIEIRGYVPDEKTISHCRRQLTKTGAGKKLFQEFDRFLTENATALKGGMILDASYIEMPGQHLSKEEKKAVDENRNPEGWGKPEKQPKDGQRDLDATWTKSNDQSFFGYKDHVKVDADSKLIIDYELAAAPVHDSLVFKTLITKVDQGATVWADSAYAGLENQVHSILNKVQYEVHEKAYKKSFDGRTEGCESRKVPDSSAGGTLGWFHGELDERDEATDNRGESYQVEHWYDELGVQFLPKSTVGKGVVCPMGKGKVLELGSGPKSLENPRLFMRIRLFSPKKSKK